MHFCWISTFHAPFMGAEYFSMACFNRMNFIIDDQEKHFSISVFIPSTAHRLILINILQPLPVCKKLIEK